MATIWQCSPPPIHIVHWPPKFLPTNNIGFDEQFPLKLATNNKGLNFLVDVSTSQLHKKITKNVTDLLFKATRNIGHHMSIIEDKSIIWMTSNKKWLESKVKDTFKFVS